MDCEDWDGREEKEEASLIFRQFWERAKGWESYLKRKECFLVKQQQWKKVGQGDKIKDADLKNEKKREREAESSFED